MLATEHFIWCVGVSHAFLNRSYFVWNGGQERSGRERIAFLFEVLRSKKAFSQEKV